MNGTSDINETVTDDGGEFDPRDAAELLDRTRRRARRQFQPNPPLLALGQAVVVLVAYGGIWLSVRGQHPYQGPNALALIVAYGLVAIVAALSVTFTRRATAGVTGTSRPGPAVVTVLATAWISVYVFSGALKYAGVSKAIVYGLYPATAPLMILGLVGAGISAGKGDRRTFGITLAVAVIGAVSAFGGPVGAWAFAGVGLCLALLTSAVVTARLGRA